MTKSKRDREVVRLQPLVRKIALRLRGSLPASVELDDLISEGTIGLMDAFRRFDPSRGVKLEHFAARRIRGAMLDWLRHEDPHGRYARERMKQDPRGDDRWQTKPVPDVESIPGGYVRQDMLAISRQQRLALARAIAGLPWRYREIVKWCDIRGERQYEIAARLGLDPSRISQQRSEAIGMLRRMMA